MKVHELKIWPEFFSAIVEEDYRKRKTVEIRNEADRHFEAGDFLYLHEYDPEKQEYTGRRIIRLVTHVLRRAPFVPSGYAAMSICETPGLSSDFSSAQPGRRLAH
jgi:hypothetical protein